MTAVQIADQQTTTAPFTPRNAMQHTDDVVSFPNGTSALVRGHLELATTEAGIRPLRLPRRYWSHFPPAGAILRTMVSQTSGVRLVVRTAATTLTLIARSTQLYVGPIAGVLNAYVACVDGQPVARVTTPVDAIETIDFATGEAEVKEIRPASRLEFAGLPAGDKEVVIWLPQSVTVDLVSIEADADVQAAAPSDRRRWIHHGSSISHGVEAEQPISTWPAVASVAADLELVNLGFGGQCMLDSYVADAIAATPADVITLKVGINIVGARSMDQRTFVPALHAFLDRVRVGHPHTPIVLISAITWPDTEDTPGPCDIEFLPDGAVRGFTVGDPADVARGALTLAISRDHVRHVADVRAGEGEVIAYLDGRELYGPGDVAAYPLPDGLHPDRVLYEEMGRRFDRLVFGDQGVLSELVAGPVTP